MTQFESDLLSRCDFPGPGTAVNCAVSGGADSLALLVLAIRAGCEVTAIHVDHGLRPQSDKEAIVVAEAAERIGAAFRAERVQVGPGPNLEARARAARYEILPNDVLTGHTADDQAETVLLNLLRGAGINGLAGMKPEGHPLLRIRRRETEQLCAESGLVPVIDSTNVDPSFLRNRIRHEVLPLLDEVAQRDVAAVIARQTDVLREDAFVLDLMASAIDPTDARELASIPIALARRAVRAWLRKEFPEQHPPDVAAVERVLAVARGEAKACDVADGLSVRRSQQRLALERPETT